MDDNEFIKNLEVIQKGVYGKDVRQAIYDLFKYQDKLISSLGSGGNGSAGSDGSSGGIIVVVNPTRVNS